MILGSAAAVIVPCLIVGGILFNVFSRSLLSTYKERSVQMAKDIAQLVDTTLQQELHFTTVLSFDPVIVEAADSGNYGQAARKLNAIHRGIPDPNYTYLMADRNGIVRADAAFEDSVGLDLSDRPYFVKARLGHAAVFGPLRARVSPTSKRASEIIVMISSPIYGRNGFEGIIAEAIRINRFTQVVSSLRIGQSGHAYVVDSDGFFIVHPNEAIILKANINNEPRMVKITETLRNHETGSESYAFRGTEKIAGYAPVATTGWTVVFTQDRAEILAPIRAVLPPVLLGALALVVLAVVFAILASRKITDPVEMTIDLLQRMTAQASDLILNIGVDRKILFANPAAQKVMASGSGGIVGTLPILTNLQNTPAEEIWKDLEAGRAWGGLLQITGNGADPLTFTTVILPVRSRAGVIQSYLEIAKDITTELTLENRLRQSQKMEALGSMAGGIAHDFNNILMGIFGFSELSLSVAGNPEETNGYVREIMRAAERARDLTRQILMFSRQTRLELRPTSPKDIITEAVRLMRVSTPPSIDIRLEITSNSIIMAEPTQVHQVIVNLCTNAISALGDEAGTIDIGLEDRNLDEEFVRLHPGLTPGKHVLLRVSDSGPGIDPAIIDRIFDPFFTTKQQGKGTGLGLSVVHGIVSKLNGTISVYSKLGQGTTFNILIPVARTAESAADRVEESLPRGTERVLLVDDEPAIVKTMSTSLVDLGYTVVSFTDSGEACEAFERDPGGVDLLVTDNIMPGMGGIELARRVMALRSDMPVVLCSGYFTRDAESTARAAGIQKLLTKPLSIYTLAAAVRTALSVR